MANVFNRKHLLGIRELSAGEIVHLLDTAETFSDVSRREIKKVPALRGRTIINLFFEPSTRTRTSFEIAAKRLSADAVNISVSTSSVTKGETLLDTARNLEAMAPACIVVRHSMAGAPHHLARMCNAPIVNAGDGAHEHPTQALLDALTIREHEQRIEDAIEGADVVMILRIQRERQDAAFFPSMREYAIHYGLHPEHLERAAPEAIVMHPGPINRGIEIASEIADSNRSLILDQVGNGVAVRMAVLYLLAGGGRDDTEDGKTHEAKIGKKGLNERNGRRGRKESNT